MKILNGEFINSFKYCPTPPPPPLSSRGGVFHIRGITFKCKKRSKQWKVIEL